MQTTTVNAFGSAWTGPSKATLGRPSTGLHEFIKVNKDSSTATIEKKRSYHCHHSTPQTMQNFIWSQKIEPHHLQSPTLSTEVYCYCQQPYNRELTKGCNKNCKIALYPYDCVSVRKHPLTTWFCPSCRTSTSKRVTIVEPADA